ncbi:MAG: chorismate mutase [Eubacteriaceae bacterium]|jgi:monofunctional chorismate mutase
MTEDIKIIREKIDRIDTQIASLFEQRMDLMKQVRQYKKERNLPVLDSGREQAILQTCGSRIEDPELRPLYVEFQEKLIELGRKRQSDLEAGERQDKT